MKSQAIVEKYKRILRKDDIDSEEVASVKNAKASGEVYEGK